MRNKESYELLNENSRKEWIILFKNAEASYKLISKTTLKAFVWSQHY